MAAATPAFSVVLPAFNRAHIVMEAVESVLKQTYPNFELIIVDDHSTDDSWQLLGTITDPRVTVVKNSHTKGVSGARNTGIDLAKAEWLCQIDSDDLWAPDFLEWLAKGVANATKEVGIVYGSDSWVDNGVVSRVNKAEVAGYAYPRNLGDWFFSHCAAAVRTSLLRAIGGYDEALSDHEDSDLQLRLTERCHLLPVPEAMYYYRRGGGDQVTRDYKPRVASLERFMNKHADLFKEYPAARFNVASIALASCIRGGLWQSGWKMWLKLLPAAWHQPWTFVRYQKRAVFLLTGRLFQSK